ncbi:hypothetical protein [Nitrososphaera sp. AFS]|uniref:hypothetical protein n=1 Tax=Nitrososphaera sp. AFS TaxID=2301191 RepID=UPI001392350D|nr:hypothetical protein [Nitrososphaera sp. AFS]NAL78411.1 hypothetical protein [Nitrososphaera sp. AFS]
MQDQQQQDSNNSELFSQTPSQASQASQNHTHAENIDDDDGGHSQRVNDRYASSESDGGEKKRHDNN